MILKASFITDEGVAQLKRNAREFPGLYTNENSWFAGFVEGKDFVRPANIDMHSLPELIYPASSKNDADNAIAIFEAMKNLNPVQAMDERLWCWLTHGPYWKYAVSRWGSNKPDTVISRFFLKGRGIGALSRNAIARLWWGAYLTRDESLDDVYLLTKVLFGKQDLHLSLMDRNLAKSADIRRSVLSFCHEQEEAIVKAGGWSKTSKRLLLDLNNAGGMRLLDVTSSERIYEILKRSLQAGELKVA